MQKALFSWITLATPRIPQLALAFAVPNGGKRDPREAARLKGLGVRPGVPDVMIPANNLPTVNEWCFDPYRQLSRLNSGFYAKAYGPENEPTMFTGLAIELKAGKNGTTPEQKAWHERLREAGWQVTVCRSFDEARAVICNYLGVKP